MQYSNLTRDRKLKVVPPFLLHYAHPCADASQPKTTGNIRGLDSFIWKLSNL